MPNMDKTGPRGEGPKTGRQLGSCKEAQPIKRGLGRGFKNNRRLRNRNSD